MLKVLGILGVCVVILMIEGPSLIRKGQRREFCLFFILLILGGGLSIGSALQLNVPNPLAGLSIVFKPFSDFIFQFM